MTTELFSRLNADTWQYYRDKSDILYVVCPDGINVIAFEDLVDGVEYHAVRKLDHPIRCNDDHERLKINSSRTLLDDVLLTHPNSQLHQNLKIFRGKSVAGKFDAVVLGPKSDSTFAIVMEAKTKVHENDVERMLAKKKAFEDFVSESATLEWSNTSDPEATQEPFAHFGNVKRVIPCLAGTLFTAEHVKSCLKEGIIPIYPSGGRYNVKLSELLKMAK